MVDINLPEDMDMGFWEQIPSQRITVNKMMKKGIISDYSLSMDRQKLWVIINGESRKEIHRIVNSFPIRKYITYSVHSLLFHERNNISVPQFWLN